MAVSEGKLKLLVADDDPFVRDMLAVILEASGYSVAVAEDGKEAFDKFSADPGTDLIISDMNMPGMDGLELLKKVRESGFDVPVIILTGNNEISVAIDSLKSGVSDYLLKDENIQEVIAISVEKVMEKYNLKKQNIQLMNDLAQNNKRLEKEKALAQNVQNNILPRHLKFDGFEIGTFYRPSDMIGGDFFDAWQTQNGLHFLIGDVSGHSTSSALIMAVSKGIMQSLGHTMGSPSEVVEKANRMLCDIVTDSGMFLSVVYGIFSRESGSLSIVSAGHNPVFLIEGGTVRTIESTGPVIGWDPGDCWQTHSLGFDKGTGLFLYTDGLTEAKNGFGEDFGEERLKGLLSGGTPPEVIDRVFRAVADYCAGEFPDDLTMFLIKRNGNGG
ncbi:MAG: SpoIIE family protein phosphatase [Thermodesulfovibrionales bacterium]|nr:SpoIIE family protein phosphatase [Thermodesulfovibrionales bacterium]